MTDLNGRSLLAIFAHPDDESIACGGLLARCAELGARVSLICATHGENLSGERDERLYEVRPKELEAAARVLGIDNLIVYDYPDGFLPWIDTGEFEERLARDIRRIQPDVVITFGEDGLYWHPDHIAVCEATTAAVRSCGDQAPALFYVTMPPGVMRRVMDEYVAQVAHAAPGSRLLGIANPDAFGLSAEPPTLVVDVKCAAARKLTALQCHQTQVADSALAQIRIDDAPRLFGIEHFHRAPVGSMARAFIEEL